MVETILSLILNYLKEKKYIETLVNLQLQSKTSLRSFPKEIQFFKKIILKGDFNQAIQFINTFEHKIQPQLFRDIILNLYKQKLYQLIENPEENELKNLFEKQLIAICTQEEYQHLFTLLTCKSVKQTAGMSGWTVMKGRYFCFEEILPHLEQIFPYSLQSDDSLANLQEIVKLYLESCQEEEEKQVRRQTSTDKESIQERKKYRGKESSEASRNKHCEEKISEVPRSESSIVKELNQPYYQKAQYEIQRGSKHFQKKSKPYIISNSQLSKNKEIQGYENEGRIPSDRDKLDENEEWEPKSKHPKINYLKQLKEPNESDMYHEDSRNNPYLDQNNSSVVYADEENENFTFSNNVEQSGFQQKPRKILKLCTLTDTKAIRTCQFSSTGKYFAFGTNSSILKIYDVQDLFDHLQPRSLEPIYEIPKLHLKSIFCLDWSSNQRAIATCSNDLTIKITEFPDHFSMKSHKTSILGNHDSCIRMVKFNSLENKLISCGDDGLIKVWDLGKSKKCTLLKGHTQSVNSFKLTETDHSKILYSVSKDCTIRKWDLRVGESVGISPIQESQITYIANNVGRIVVSHKNGEVSFFTSQLELNYSMQVHEQQIRSIDGLQYNETLLTASFDGHISLFSERNSESPNYHQHNENEDDKVVFATFLNHPEYRGFASTSTLGLCNIYCYE